MLRLLLLTAGSLATVQAHIALWDSGMFGLNYPYQANDTSNIAWNNNAPVNPLREMDALTETQWFGHGFLDYPPAAGEFMELPAGGTYHGEHGCNRAETSLRNPSISDPLPYYACPAGEGSTGVGALHTMNTYNGTFDAIWQGGAALAIAYTSDPWSLQPNDLTVISINQTAVWARAVDYQIPAGMPPCPTGGCLCSWNWIHEANHGEGYPYEMYNVLYRCMITGAIDSTQTVQRGAVPVDCTSNSAACVTGPKTPMYIYQYTGNNIEHLATPPNYKSTWGFNDGAQNDIFVKAANPAPTTYIVNAYATPTGTTVAGGTPTATALPSGWINYGCSTDQSYPRALNGPSTTDSTNNTIEGCVSSCASQGYTWAGVEYGQECWCGTQANINPTNSSNCNMPCTGDEWAKCGGSYAINVYFGPSTAVPVNGSTSLPSGWTNYGCFTDTDSPRTLPSDYTVFSNNTWAQCSAKCQADGWSYAGVEYGNECWCGNSLNMSRSTTSGCDVPCAGDDATFCGGSYRVQVFGVSTTTTTTTTTTTALPTTTMTNSTSVMPNTTTVATNTSIPTATAQVNTTTTVATTNTTSPIISPTNATTTENSTTYVTSTNTTSPVTSPTSEKTSTTSTSSTTITSPATTKPTTTTTSTTTTKAATTTTSTTTAATATSTILLAPGFTDLGCNVGSGGGVLPFFMGSAHYISGTTCSTMCSAYGFKYAGTQGTNQCWCGDIAKLVPASSGCTYTCAGDKTQTCGGAGKMNIYGPAVAPTTCTLSWIQQFLVSLSLMWNPCA